MSSIFLDTFGDKIKKALKDKTKFKKFIDDIYKFFDKQHEILSMNHPGKRMIFVDPDEEPLFLFLDTTRDEWDTAIKNCKIIKSTWVLLRRPFAIGCCYVLRQMIIDKFKEEEIDAVSMFLACKIFSGVQLVYFKFEANPQVMNYTISQLSQQYDYRVLGNNFAVIKDTVKVTNETYVKNIVKGDDEFVTVYIPQLENRLNKKVKGIAQLYYDNREDKNYLNLERSENDEGQSLDTSSSSALIINMADGAAHGFMINTINMVLVKTCAQVNDIPFSVLHQSLTNIKVSIEHEKIRQFYRSLLNICFELDTTFIERVCSKEFAVKAVEQLSISNSSSPDLEFIKDTLHEMLTEHCAKYSETQRTATKISYRKALYSYFVYNLIISRCG